MKARIGIAALITAMWCSTAAQAWQCPPPPRSLEHYEIIFEGVVVDVAERTRKIDGKIRLQNVFWVEVTETFKGEIEGRVLLFNTPVKGRCNFDLDRGGKFVFTFHDRFDLDVGKHGAWPSSLSVLARMENEERKRPVLDEVSE